MTPERWQRAKRLFEETLELPDLERRNFLDQACGDDPTLQRDVESLLVAFDDAGTFIDRPAVAPIDERPLERVGRYRILGTLGHGGMGAVYLGQRDDDVYRQQVAIKVVHAGLGHADLARRFRDERQILADLEHPNIAKLLDGGSTDDGRPYLVVEYVDGAPLDVYCRQHELGIDERLRLFEKVCDAVRYAHENLVVHRDLKPANILVDTHGEPKLLDFGIAKLLRPERFAHTVIATVPGLTPMTPEYASPEQMRGGSITTATDVYALGVMLYELLTGVRPYDLADLAPQEVVQLVCERDPAKPSTRRLVATSAASSRARRHLRGDLDAIVMMALRKEAVHRYRSVEHLRDDVDRYLTGQPVLARRGDVLYKTGKFVRRHWLGVATAAAVLALLIGFTISLAIEQRKTEHARTDAENRLGFILDLFENADPGRSKGEDVTVREVLDRGRPSLDRLAGQPEAQADLLEMMARVYHAIGAYDRSKSLIEEAIPLRDTENGGTPEDLASTLDLLADVLSDTGAVEIAEPEQRRSLALFEDELGRDHPRTATVRSRLALLLDLQGRYDEAEPLHRRALASLRRQPEESALIQVIAHLASHLDATGKLEESAALFEEALGLQRARDARHPRTARLLNNLALVTWHRGDLDRAEALFAETFLLQQAFFPSPHAELATTINNQGLVALDQGAFAAAEDAFREALAMRRTIYTGDHHKTASNLNDLATALLARGKLDEAETVLVEAIDMAGRTFQDDHIEQAAMLANLAHIRQQKGDLEAAEHHLRESVRISRAALGSDNTPLAKALNNLGQVLVARGDFEGGLPLLQEALGINRKLLGADHQEVAINTHNLAGLLARNGRYDEAEPLFVTARDAMRRTVGSSHENVATMLRGQALRLLDAERASDAEPLLRESLAISRGNHGDGDRTWRTQAILGSCLGMLGEQHEAEALLREAHTRMQASDTAQPRHRERVAERLARFLETPPEADRPAG